MRHYLVISYELTSAPVRKLKLCIFVENVLFYAAEYEILFLEKFLVQHMGSAILCTTAAAIRHFNGGKKRGVFT